MRPHLPRPRLNPLLLTLILLAILAACTWPGYGTPPTVSAGGPLVLITPGATLTATPLRPWTPTATYFPTATPSPTPTPTATATPRPQPGPPSTPVPFLTESLNHINIVLLGSDRRPGHLDFRTDTLIFLSYNPATGSTLMVSIPRDTYVYLPGLGYQRINTAMEFGGFHLLTRTLEFNFGIRPDYYILINFQGFKALIDRLGGVDITLSRAFCDPQHCIGPGTVHLDGDLALWYARSRKTSSDFDRARRQQQLLIAIAHKLFSLYSLSQLPDLYNIFRDLVVTNLTPKDMLTFVPQMGRFTLNQVHTLVLAPPTYGTPWITPQGAYVVLPNIPAIQEALRQALVR